MTGNGLDGDSSGSSGWRGCRGHKKGAGDILKDPSVLKGEEEGAAAAEAEAVAGKDVAMKGDSTAASCAVEHKKVSEM